MNNLLPGTVFVILLEYFTKYSLIQESLILGIFLYYFIGLIISRIGSLLIEKPLRKIGFLHFSSHDDFVLMSKRDEDIKILSEQNNQYRSLISMIIILFLVKIWENLYYMDIIEGVLVLVVILGILLFAYRKQTEYICSRVEKNK